MRQNTLLVYVSCGQGQEIICFGMDRETGSLTRLGTTKLPEADHARSPDAASPFSTTGAPLAASRDGAFLYAAIRAEPFRIISYRIDPDSGALTQIGEAPLPAGMVYLSIDREGRFLFGAAYYGELVSVSRVAADGGIMEPAAGQVGELPHAHSVIQHPNGHFVYVGATLLKEVQTLSFDGAGKLAPTGLPVRNASLDGTPRHLAFHPQKDFLYGIHETSGIVESYAVAATGQLTCLQSIDRRAPADRNEPGIGADLRITPDGRYLYASARAQHTITAYAIDPASGMLSHVQTLPVEKIPRSLAIDRSSRYLVAAGQGADRITVYGIDERGSLTRIGSAETGGSPIWVEII